MELQHLYNRMRTARLSEENIQLIAQAVEFAMENGFFDECTVEQMVEFDQALGEL